MLDPSLLRAALDARSRLIDDDHVRAFRVFNGPLEGDPRFVIDVYARSAVVFHYDAPFPDDAAADRVVAPLRERLPWLDAIVLKEREGTTDEARRGRVVYARDGGAGLAREVHEHGVRYAVDLTMNQDASFYLDTRLLRRWLVDTSGGKSVLNTFAYTGSLGVAARAGGASRVVHNDLAVRFLNVAKASYGLNGFEIDGRDFQARDFFSFVRGLKLQETRFDRVVLDPPFFSTTRGGTVDLNRNVARLINKVRPLVRSGGDLVVVNNSLFVSGADFLRDLESLCEGGWLTIERRIDVPEDSGGFAATRRGAPPVDPAPFDHSTKIVVLSVRHK